MLQHFPVQLTAFVGRTRETAEVLALLRQPHCRLLTLVGPGGAGKTRLALEAARTRAADLRDGAVFVALQPVPDAEFVIHAIAAALGIQTVEGPSAQDSLLQILQGRQLLLVLDNAEHVLDAAPLLVKFLEQVPELQLLVTSREVLHIVGEQICEVGGLALDGADVDSDAMRLFITRAVQSRHDFDAAAEHDAVAQICRQVGGLPLAIELAAAWTRTLTCAEIAAEIERSADFLAVEHRNLPERHRSLRAVFEQSWARLSPVQQQVFSRLAVFSGHFTREAASSIAGASLNVLSALVDQSLIQVGQEGQYAIHSLLRQYAEERLRALPTEYEQTQAAHAEYYLGLVTQLDRQLKSGGQIDALQQLDRLQDNIRQAWCFAVEHHRRDLITATFEALTLYYQMRCRLPEAYDMFSRAAEAFELDGDLLAGLLLLAKGWFTTFSGANSDDEAQATIKRGMAILARQTMPGLGAMLLWSGRTSYVAREDMRRLLRENEAAYQARGDDWGLAWTISRKEIDDGGGRRRSREFLEAGIAAARRCGDRWSATWPQAMLGLLAEEQGRADEALRLYAERLETCRQVGDKGGVAWSLHQLAKVSLDQHDMSQAIFYCRESLRVALEISSVNSVNEAIWRISTLYRQRGEVAKAVELLSTISYATGHYISRYLAVQVEKGLQAAQAQLSTEAYSAAVEAGRHRTPRQLGMLLLDALDDLRADAPSPAQQPTAPMGDALSEREIEVLRLVAAGLSNSEVAERLVVTTGTVKKHLNNIYGKLGVERRTQALLRAYELGLIDQLST